VNSDGEEVTSDGKSFHTSISAREGAATDSRKSDTSVTGPESVPRRDIGGARELLGLLLQVMAD